MDGYTHTIKNTIKGKQHKEGWELLLYMVAYRPILWRHFLNRGFLHSDDYSVCQVDRDPTSTVPLAI